MRTLCIVVDQWAAFAVDRNPATPLVVVSSQKVLAANRSALLSGIKVGMRRRDAQAICPSVLLHPHDPDQSARHFGGVLAVVDEFVPRVEVPEPGCCQFLTIGPARYHGGEDALVTQILSRLASVLAESHGYVPTIGIAVADGPRVAAIVARESIRRSNSSGGRSGSQSLPVPLVIPPDEAPQFLERLSIRHLEDMVGGETVDLLWRLGLRTMGAFASLDPGDVLARFGGRARDAHLMVNGNDQGVLDLNEHHESPRATRTMEPPLERVDQVAFLARAMAQDLVGELKGQGVSAAKVLIAVETEAGERIERVWHIERSFSVVTITQRVRWQLEGWISSGRGISRQQGAVSFLLIQPEELHPERGEQAGFWGGVDDRERQVANGMARLQGLFGPDSVRVPRPKGGRSPRDAYQLVEFDPSGSDRGRDSVAGSAGVEGPWPGSVPAPSPSRVWDEPLPVEVLDISMNRVGVSGRGVISAAPGFVSIEDTVLKVAAWSGPWCVEERWWDPLLHRRKARVQVLVHPDGQPQLNNSHFDARRRGHPTGLTAHLVTLEAGRWWIEATYD